MDIEKEDYIEFDELLADKRHKEITGTLRGIALLLNKPPDQSVPNAIEKLANKLGEIKTPDLKQPEVKVEINQDKVVTSVEELSRNLLEELRKFNERPVADKFHLERDYYGNIISVKIVYKN